MDDEMTAAGRRPSAMAMLAAGALGAAVLGVGGVAYAQTAEPTDPGAGVTQEECEEKAGGARADASEAPTSGATSSDA